MAKKTFTLSANIENGIVEGSTYIVTPNVQKVLQEIIDGYQTGIHSYSIIGTYGTGKSSFLLQLEHDLMEMKNRSLLKNPKVLYDGQFEILNVLGDSKSLYDLLLPQMRMLTGETEGDVLTLMKHYCDKLKKQNKLLLFVIDEFGKVLEHAAKNNPDEELYFMQKLCEVVNAPNRNVLLLTTLHQNFSAYSRKLTAEQKNEWTKVKGRFQEVVFAEPIEQLLFLAAEHISAEYRYKVTDSYFHKIYHLAVERKFISSDFTFETASKLYPMDTFAAYAVTRAIQRYGQNERSLFTFLNAKGAHSITAFIPKKNETYSLAEVYDYIVNSFHSYLNDVNNDSTGWSAIRLSIERVEGGDWADSDQMLDAIKMVKAVGLLNLFGNAGFTMTQADMADYATMALGIEYASTLLHELIRQKIIRYAEYKKRLILFEGTDINIEQEMINAGLVVPKPVNYVDDLRSFFNNRVSPVKAYYYHRGTPRYFEYQLLSQPQDIVPVGDVDGYVQMIFATTDKQYKELVEFSRNCEHAIIFAYFNNTDELVAHVHNIQKYRYIVEKVLVDKSDRVALKEIVQLMEYEKTLLNKALSESLFSYSEDVVWLYKGEEKDINSQRDFNKLLSVVCEDVYSLTPIINNELFNKHKLSSNISGAKAKYLQALLDNSNKTDLGFEQDKFPPEKTIYYSLLRNTGLHINGEFNDAPTNDDIKSLWDACEEFLNSTREKARKLSELVKKLTAQPYKIKDGVLEFWLPTYLFIKRQDYSLYGENGQYIPNFNLELLDLMKKHIGEFKIKAYAVDGVKLQLFNQYRKFLNLGDNRSIKGGAFIETIKPFLFFYNRQLNDYAKHTKSLPHEETIKFREVLARAKDPEKAFLEDLPEALGYDDDKLKDKDAVQDYCYVIQRAVRELRGCYNQLIDRIEENLIESLGLKSGEYAEYVQEIQQRLSKVKPHLLNPRQKEFYQHAIAQFDNRTEWYQSVCFAVLGSPLERMTDDQEPKLHDDIVYLFKECEQKAVLSESLNYKIDEKEEQRSYELESKINDLLTGDDNLDVYTLMRILQKKLNND
ncbi:hypothetical protein [Xylanibacter brevis]|uniref:hypothetical protein n=1 Tax=Xylanibacter brevis TaxID=83231 RepID=UPI0005C6882A|nr:hypothetical protein [Xylanibacter brevis]